MHFSKKSVHSFCQNLREIHHPPQKKLQSTSEKEIQEGKPTHAVRLTNNTRMWQERVTRYNSETQQNVTQNPLPPSPAANLYTGRQTHTPLWQSVSESLHCSFPAQQLEHKDSLTVLLKKGQGQNQPTFPVEKARPSAGLACFRPPTQSGSTPCLSPGRGLSFSVPRSPVSLCPSLITLAKGYFILRSRKDQPLRIAVLSSVSFSPLSYNLPILLTAQILFCSS